MKIVATTLLPAVDRPNADRWNADHSRQLYLELPNVLQVSRKIVFRSASEVSARRWALVDPKVFSIQNISMALSFDKLPLGFLTRCLESNYN